jgi:hypothetical protein
VEKNAKIAEVVAKKKQEELQKIQAEMAKVPTLPAIPPTVHVGSGKAKSKSGHGPPQTIVAGSAPAGKKSGASVANSGIPKGPTVKTPKILARPNNAPPGTLHPMSQAGPSNQPLFPSGQASGNVLPANTQLYPNQPAPMAKSRNSTQLRHQQSLPTQSSSYVTQGMPNVTGSNFFSSNPGGSSSFGYDSAGSMPLMGGDNKYFGSSGQPNSAPPPGFKSSVLPPSNTINDPSLNAVSNPLGEIRATAREFVPTSFAPVQKATPSGMELNAVPSMSSQPATVSHSPPENRSASNEVSSLLDPMSSLLNTAVPAPVTKSDSPVQSATSSITGFSGTVEEATTSRVGSALTFESAVGGLQTSSILETIGSYSGADSGLGGLGSGGIWGDSINNQSSNLGGLVGLNFSSFLGVDQKNNGQPSSNQGNTSTWGTGTGGSIW